MSPEYRVRSPPILRKFRPEKLENRTQTIRVRIPLVFVVAVFLPPAPENAGHVVSVFRPALPNPPKILAEKSTMAIPGFPSLHHATLPYRRVVHLSLLGLMSLGYFSLMITLAGRRVCSFVLA